MRSDKHQDADAIYSTFALRHLNNKNWFQPIIEQNEERRRKREEKALKKLKDARAESWIMVACLVYIRTTAALRKALRAHVQRLKKTCHVAKAPSRFLTLATS